ncbi:MAG: DUF1499 domain-containing protein [Myxococcota bacterium]
MLLALAACAAAGAPEGVGAGVLAPCPPTPNCVSTEATDPEHAIAPLRFAGDPAAAHDRLVAVIAAMPRARVVRDEPRYLHVAFTSRVLRFVDDVELVVGDGEVRFRSASRVGRGDLGVNRARMEAIRAAFEGGV